MARCNRFTSTQAAARAIAVALLLCLGLAPGWAKQNDSKPAQDGSTKPAQSKPTKPAPAGSTKPAPAGSTKPAPAGPTKPAQQAPQPKPQGSDQSKMRGLDEQIQEIKSDVLGMTQELNRLEEKLLYPSGTQVAVFVGLAKDDTLRLDAVRLQIDGQLVAHYIYSAKELEALRKGGVQRIYVGNVATGDHQLEVLVDGKLDSGADFSRTEHFAFRKEVKPKLVGLTVAGSGNPPIALGEW